VRERNAIRPDVADDALAGEVAEWLVGHGRPLGDVPSTTACLHALAATGLLARIARATQVRRDAALTELGAHDLSLARLAEGHVDAVRILAQTPERLAPADGPMGVWASDPPDGRVRATPTASGWRLDGCKRWCSGAGGSRHVLLTAHAPDGYRLFVVSLEAPGVSPVADTWAGVGMVGADTRDVELDRVEVPTDAAIGGPGWYLDRVGFGAGGVSVAAVWYGGAVGLARTLRTRCTRRADAHDLAALGAVDASCTGMRAVLRDAGARLDAGTVPDARTEAQRVRAVVEAGCHAVLGEALPVLGATPLGRDRVHARRAADLPVYLRQHHGPRDRAALGQRVLDEEPAW
jgi:alkylation response protein AidB-like acyl-CoA dehydrogenase